MQTETTKLHEGDDPANLMDTLHYGEKVAEDYIPEGFDSQEDYLSDLRKDYALDLDYDRENREAALDDKKFAAGEQWDPIVLEQRQGLPCLVINSVPQFTAQLVGDWRENKKSIKVLASEDGDKDVADIRGDLVRSIEWKSRAARTYDTAFESLVQCGDGAFRVSVEYAKTDVFDQDIFIRPIDDALSVVWDRMSIDPTGRDARHCFVDDLMPRKEFERKWPETAPSTLSTELRTQMWNGGWIEEGGVRVTEHWRMIERDRLLCLFEDGSVRFIDASNMEEMTAKHGMPTKTRVAPCTYAQMHLVTGFKILSGPYEYQLDRVPIIRMSGRVVNIAGRRVRYGLVRFMKDSVRLRNFWRSVAAEQLGYAPKAQWMATESAIEGREEDLRKAHLTRNPLLIFNDEAEFGRNVLRMDPPAPQMALINEANMNAQDMKDVTGIHDASLGMKSNETSGKAINARQREGDIASLTYYDNGNASLLEAGDVINQLIGQIYDGTRIVRIVGEDEAQKFIKINDPNDPNSPNLAVGNYDVALSTGPSYTTRVAEAGEAMMNAIQVFPQLMEVAGDEIVKAQSWPGADKIAERMKKAINPAFLDDNDPDKQAAQQANAGPQVSPEQIQEAMQRMQELEQENHDLKQKYDLELEKLKIEQYNAETLRIRALSDNEVDGNQQELDAIQSILDHSRALEEIEVKKSQANSKPEGSKPPSGTPSQP